MSASWIPSRRGFKEERFFFDFFFFDAGFLEGAPSAMAIGKRQERAMPLPTLFSSRGVRRAVQPQHDDTAAFAVR